MPPPAPDERWIAVTGAGRPGDRISAEQTAPSVEEVRARAGDPAGRPVLGGGEPTLRADLPALIAATSEAGPGGCVLATDGLAFARPGPLASLSDAGLTTLRVRLASFRSDAHDWFVGHPGATRLAARALRAASEGGLRTEVEVPLLRPTVGHLDEVVAAATRLGASAVLAVALDPDRFAVPDRVALAPRLGLLAGPLLAAAREAERHDIAFAVAGLPACFLPDGVAACTVRTDRPRRTEGCGSRCPGGEACPGLPEGYVDLFGRTELPLDAPDPDAPAIEPFAGTSREIRMRLVRHSGRAATLRITSVEHGDSAALLREATRLGFGRVEVVADLGPLAHFTDDELRRLRRLTALSPTAPPPPGLLDRIRRIAPDVELPSPS